MAKRLKREGNKIINEHGVIFTQREATQLKNLVRTASRKRSTLLQKEDEITQLFAGKNYGVGRFDESDFILRPKTASLQRFERKSDFDRYIGHLQKVAQRDYIENRVEQYRENQTTALQNVFGQDANSILYNQYDEDGKLISKGLTELSNQDFMRTVQGDSAFEIGYIYEPQQRAIKLEALKDAIAVANSSS